MNKILLFLTGLSTGLILGFSVAAWALYEPIPVGPAKYGFNHSPGPVPQGVRCSDSVRPAKVLYPTAPFHSG